jgi:predicted transcriptional regulator
VGGSNLRQVAAVPTTRPGRGPGFSSAQQLRGYTQCRTPSEPWWFTPSKIVIIMEAPLERLDHVSNSERRAGTHEPLRLQDTVRLSADGLAKVLGDLEARVMRVVWALGRPSSARAVHERVAHEHSVAIHTVITVLNKLVEKGLLRREKRDDLLHFEPTLSEEEFRAQASRQVIEGILSFGPDAVTASFVDVLAERDPEQFAELARLIEKRLKEQENR